MEYAYYYPLHTVKEYNTVSRSRTYYVHKIEPYFMNNEFLYPKNNKLIIV